MPVPADLTPLERYTRLLLRGYHKLLTILAVLAICSAAAAYATRFLWVVPAEPDEAEPGRSEPLESQVDDENGTVTKDLDVPGYDEIIARTDVESKYTVYNSKLANMARRGDIAQIDADDAKRDRRIYDPAHDRWTGTWDALTGGESDTAPRMFNPKVTLSGL